jgi:hypothetical protein
MNLVVFEQNKDYIQRSLKKGTIDYLETVSEGAETEFFQYINTRGLLRHLAKTYPLNRQKTEVPIWLYIASDLSLRLHGMQSFHGYPFVIRTGGLLNALGPEVGKKVVHPQTGQVTIHCPGFNKKNKYDRQTPCDQDWLRKTARATEAEALMSWYNQEVPRLLEREKLFSPEGIFIGDASYVFVPDNPHYEGSSVMMFDEHNHPVDAEKMSREQLKRCRLRRCYKWVELIHTNGRGEFFFFVAMNLRPGKDHENPILYDLVEKFLQSFEPGTMKWLIVDRGFLDGERMGHLKKKWQVDTLTALRSDMNVLEDARGLLRLAPVKWQDYSPPSKEHPLPVVQSMGIRLIPKKPRKRPPVEKVVALNHFTSWTECPVELTVVLSKQGAKPPWGLVTTASTQDAPLLRDLYHLRESIEERHRQTKVFWDLTKFHSPNFNLVTNQIVFVGLTYTLLQMQLLSEHHPELNRLTRRSLLHQMLPYDNHIVVYSKQYYGFFDAPEYTEIVMTIEKPGKSKLLRKVRRIRRDFLSGLKWPRGP